jgi:hypothetical protein
MEGYCTGGGRESSLERGPWLLLCRLDFKFEL